MFCISMFIFNSCVSNWDKPFPSFWKTEYLFGEKASIAWHQLSDNNQLVHSKLYNFGGSGPSDDGDKEFKDAMIMFCCNNDPYNYLMNCLNSKDENKVIYSIMVISHLKDKRFVEKLNSIQRISKTKINSFFGQTISDVAQHALNRMNEEDDLREAPFNKHAASWLKESWSIIHQTTE